jgi:hypothetical protein
MSLSDLDLQSRLHDQRLRAVGAEAPADLAQRVRQRYRRQQRRRLVLAAAVVAVAAVFVAVPRIGQFLLDGDGGPASPPRLHTPSLYDVPTRGSLAGDQAWVKGVAALDWAGDTAGPDDAPIDIPVADRHVAFAGEVPGGRTAYVLGESGRRLVAAWFIGPEGAEPAQMTPATGLYTVDDGYPDALWDVTPGGDGVLVAVGQPGDSLSYMAGMDITDDGHFREVWRALETEDGVAVATVPWSPSGYGASQVRAGTDKPVYVSATDRALEREPALVRPADPRGLLDRLNPDHVNLAVVSLASTFGMPSAALDPVLLWAGRNGEQASDSSLIVGVTLPSGATAVSVVSYRPFAGGQVSEVNYQVVAAPQGPGTALLDRTIAVPTLEGIVVVGPRSGVRAEALENGEVVTAFPLDDGGGATVLPEQTYPDTVRVLDADSAVVGETTGRPETMD